MAVARQTFRFRDLLVLLGWLQHHTFSELTDNHSQNFLPRCLAFRERITSSIVKGIAAGGRLAVIDQNVCLTRAEVDAHLIAVCSSASPPPAAASGGTFNIEGDPEVPDCRPSPIQGQFADTFPKSLNHKSLISLNYCFSWS